MNDAIKLSWTDFKTKRSATNFRIVESIKNNLYVLYGIIGDVIYQCSIPITNPAGTDQDDYETNFRGVIGERVYLEKFVENHTAVASPGTVLYTVTANKTLFVTKMILTAVNTANAVGRFVIQDGTDTAKRMPFILPQQPVGAVAGSLSMPITMENSPKKFSTAIRVIGLSGTIAISAFIWGYEQ